MRSARLLWGRTPCIVLAPALDGAPHSAGPGGNPGRSCPVVETSPAEDIASRFLQQRLQSGHALPTDRWGSVRSPRLLIDGGKSPRWMRNGARALADLLAGSAFRALPGQTHMVKAEVLAPVLIEFFTRG